MKRVFDTVECEAVRNSIFWEQRYEKHENQMKVCAVEPKVSDLQMNAYYGENIFHVELYLNGIVCLIV